jgi:two-component system cell cycle response regulator
VEFDDKTSEFDPSKFTTSKAVMEQRGACFVVISGGQAGRMYKLERPDVVVGRSPDAAIRVDDEGVSRQHCRITRGPENSVVVEDLGSTNGTFINGERIKRKILQDGDKLQVGSASILKFSFTDALDEEFQVRQYESATRDVLTGCFNKKYFIERLPSEYAFAQRHQKNLAVAMMDIDHFKKINDTHGHPAGDHVLRGVGQVLSSMVRKGDLLARFGGEEFVILMREIVVSDAYVVAERIRRQVENTRYEYDSKVIPVTVSCGVAAYGFRGPESADALVALADQYLYKAKHNGRNRTECELFGAG